MHPYGGIPICPRCVKAVYAAEQIMGPGRMLYHRPCLACSSCNKRLDSLSLVEHDKEPYCKQCYNKNFGPRDLRQANLPHRDDAPTPLSSSPIRPAYTGLPTRSFRSTSPTQEEKNVEARFERAKREPERLGSSSPFGTNMVSRRTEESMQCSSPLKDLDASVRGRPLNDLDGEVREANQDEDGHDSEDRDAVEDHLFERSTPGIPRTIPLTAAHTGRTYGVSTPSVSPTRFTGSPISVPRPTTPTSPTGTYASHPSSPIRPAATGARYSAALLGSPKSANSSPWANRAMPGTGTPLCARCAKPVYFAEQAKANGRTFHKPCLRCTDCNTALDSSRLAEKGEKVVCRSCYSKHYGPQGSGYALLGKAGG